MALVSLAQSVAASPFASWSAGSALAYPVANVVHLLGLVLLVGGIAIVDLRLLGLFRQLPLHHLARALTPLAVGGFFLLAASGSVLFASDAAALATSPTFRTKLLLISLALTNALVFRMAFGRSAPEPVPVTARLMGLASLLLWLSTATMGRMIAYT